MNTEYGPKAMSPHLKHLLLKHTSSSTSSTSCDVISTTNKLNYEISSYSIYSLENIVIIKFKAMNQVSNIIYNIY